MTELEREHLILLIANDLASLLCREPAQSEAFEALMAELERACASWLRAGAKVGAQT